MDYLPSEYVTIGTNVISLLMLIISEALGVYNGHGTCSSIIQLIVSAYHRFFKKNASTSLRPDERPEESVIQAIPLKPRRAPSWMMHV